MIEIKSRCFHIIRVGGVEVSPTKHLHIAKITIVTNTYKCLCVPDTHSS